MKIRVYCLSIAALLASPVVAQAQDAYCATLDRDQYQLNELLSDLKRIYPLTYSFLKSCTTSAKTNSDMTSCMATAGTMAHCDSDDWQRVCGYSTVDFVQRMATIAQRRTDLIDRKKRHPGCVLQIPDDTAD